MGSSGRTALDHLRSRIDGGGSGRSRPERRPLPLREKWTLGALMLLVLLMFWTPSIVRWYGQIWTFLFATAAFLTLFMPLPEGHGARSRTGVENLKALLRFPLFWLGGFLLAYVWIQLFNPALVMVYGPFGSAMRQEDFIRWLPRGIVSPLQETNPFRHLMQYGAAWLVTCAVWIGIQSRRSLVVMASWMAGNGFLWALAAIVQFMLKYKKIYGFYALPPNKEFVDVPFWGTLVYPSNAACFLNLILCLCLALWFYYERRSAHQARSGGPHFVWMVCSLLVVVSAYMTVTRASIVFTTAVLVVFVGILTASIIAARRWRALGALGALFIVFAAGLGAAWYYGILERDKIIKEWGTLVTAANHPEQDQRVRHYKVMQVVLAHNWVWGWGAGSFQYVYLYYQDFYPEVKEYSGRLVEDFRTKKKSWKKVRVIWDYCHNDWIQYPLELGALGAGILGAIMLGWLGYFLRHLRYARPEHYMILGGISVVMLHSLVDFNLQMLLIHVTFALLVVMTAKWLQLQRRSALVRKETHE